jgi:hypothetical protein
MVFINETNMIGKLIVTITNNVTGYEFLTYFILLLLLYLIGMMCRIPMQVIPALQLPLLIILMSQMDQFIAIGGISLIYLSFVFVSFWPFK